MKTLNTLTLALAAAAAAIRPSLRPKRAWARPRRPSRAALTAPRSGWLTNFSGSGGQLDPVPLLETTLPCPHVAPFANSTFSAQADPGDNYGVYQASIDNVPMDGHGRSSRSILHHADRL